MKFQKKPPKKQFIYCFIVGSKPSIKANKNQVTKEVFQIPKLNRIHIAYLRGYSEPCQVSNKELFTQIVKGLKPLTAFVKSFISDVSLGLNTLLIFIDTQCKCKKYFLFLCFALKTPVELLFLISRGSIFDKTFLGYLELLGYV